MNIFKLIALILGNQVKEAAGWVQDNVTLSMRLLYVSIAVPGLLIAAGIGVGSYAYANDWATGLMLAKACMLSAGLLFGLLSTLFWVRATILIHLVSLATKVAGKFTDKVGVLSTDTAEKFVQWLRNVTAWATAVCIYAALVPFWRSLTAAAVAIICLIFFSAIYSARWQTSPRLRQITTVVALFVFAVATMAMINPGFSSAIGSFVDSSADRLTDSSERREVLGQVSAKADKAAVEIDQELLAKLGERRNAIMKRAVELCSGRFCSEAEAAEYRELEVDMNKVRSGTYWKDQIAPTETAEGSLPQLGPGADSTSVDLPPPPPSVRRVIRPKLTPVAAEDVFQELKKYSDL